MTKIILFSRKVLVLVLINEKKAMICTKFHCTLLRGHGQSSTSRSKPPHRKSLLCNRSAKLGSPTDIGLPKVTMAHKIRLSAELKMAVCALWVLCSHRPRGSGGTVLTATA